MPSDKEQQLILIKLYLSGQLPPYGDKWVEQLLEEDQDFEKLYTSYLLVHNSIHNYTLESKLEKDIEDNSAAVLQQFFESNETAYRDKRKGGYEIGKGIIRLYDLVLSKNTAAILLLSLLGFGIYKIVKPPHSALIRLTVENSGYGLTGSVEIPIVVYEKDPRWLHWEDSYKWPADTLRLYSRSLFKDEFKHQWLFRATEKDDEFLLMTHNGTYTIFNRKEELVPLKKNED